MESAEGDKNWIEKSKAPNLSYYLKKDGSKHSKTQPFFRSEVTFMKAMKI